MEVKIGVQDVARELAFESSQSAEQVGKAVTAALTSGSGVLDLVDERGRRILVPAAKLAYVEIGEPVERRVGFGTM